MHVPNDERKRHSKEELAAISASRDIGDQSSENELSNPPASGAIGYDLPFNGGQENVIGES